MIVLKIILPILVLMALGAALSRTQTTAAPDMHHSRYAEPFRGSEGGKMLARACGNCHSNQTNLPWYGHVVPISWWINKHVSEAREALNFTEWKTYSGHRRHNELESLCGAVSTGRMPPASYRIMHPEARLDAQDKKVICAWADNELDHEK